jgi:predicted nucleic acid-binding protein
VAFSALLDTCVLYPAYLRDSLLRLASAGLYRPLWSSGILEELRRNLLEAGLPDQAVERLFANMATAFEDAEITGYEDLIAEMTCHEKDRHVLAAAVRGNAGALVTFNLSDFPPASVKRYEMGDSSGFCGPSACCRISNATTRSPTARNIHRDHRSWTLTHRWVTNPAAARTTNTTPPMASGIPSGLYRQDSGHLPRKAYRTARVAPHSGSITPTKLAGQAGRRERGDHHDRVPVGVGDPGLAGGAGGHVQPGDLRLRQIPGAGVDPQMPVDVQEPQRLRAGRGVRGGERGLQPRAAATRGELTPVCGAPS